MSDILAMHGKFLSASLPAPIQRHELFIDDVQERGSCRCLMMLRRPRIKRARSDGIGHLGVPCKRQHRLFMGYAEKKKR